MLIATETQDFQVMREKVRAFAKETKERFKRSQVEGSPIRQSWVPQPRPRFGQIRMRVVNPLTTAHIKYRGEKGILTCFGSGVATILHETGEERCYLLSELAPIGETAKKVQQMLQRSKN